MPSGPTTPRPYLAIVGPTGSGKSALAMELALALNGEIVGCDSVQIYRGFDIGSAKPSAADQRLIPHHLISVIDPTDPYDAATYAGDATAAIAAIERRGRLSIVVGGTGLYLRALLGQGFTADLPGDPILRAALRQRPLAELWSELKSKDPERAQQIHPNDRFRVERALELVKLLGRPLREAGITGSAPADPRAVVVVVERERSELHRLIAERTLAMTQQGLVSEVQGLLAAGVPQGAKPMQSIGYAQAAAFLAGQLAQEDLLSAIEAATRQYAKRQITWFRKVDAALRLDPSRVAVHEVIAALRERL